MSTPTSARLASVSAIGRGRAVAAAVLAGTATLVLARLLAQAVYDERIPWVADVLMRSRSEYPFEVYWSGLLRVPVAVLVASVAAAVLVQFGWPHRPKFSDARLRAIEGRLSGKLLPLALLWWLAVAAVARSSGRMAFATNDDGMMMLAVSGAYGSDPSPLTGFIHVLLGRVLVALYTSPLDLPWYGLMMVGGQVVGLAVITWLLAAAFLRFPNIALGAAFLAVLMIGSYLVIAIQFTQVAITLSAAGFAMLLRPKDGPLTAVEMTSASLMLLLATMIRGNAVLLVALMAFGILVPLLMGRSAAPRRAGIVVALLVTMGGAALAAADDGRFDPPGSIDWRADLLPSGANISSSLTDYWESMIEVRFPPASANDRAMATRWLFPTADLFDPEDEAVTAQLAVGIPTESQTWSFDGLSLRRALTRHAAFGLLLLVVGLYPRTRPSVRLMSLAASIVPMMAVGVLAAFARAPVRVTVATLLMGASLLVLLRSVPSPGAAADEGADRAMRRLEPRQGVVRGVMFTAAVVAIAGAGLDLTRVQAQNVTSARAFQSDAIELLAAGSRPATVIVWLSPFFDGLDPLVTPEYFIDHQIVDVAGWHSVMPFHRDRMQGLGLSDWIGDLQRGERVALVSDASTATLISTFLDERRGSTCSAFVVDRARESLQLIASFESGECN